MISAKKWTQDRKKHLVKKIYNIDIRKIWDYLYLLGTTEDLEITKDIG